MLKGESAICRRLFNSLALVTTRAVDAEALLTKQILGLQEVYQAVEPESVKGRQGSKNTMQAR